MRYQELTQDSVNELVAKFNQDYDSFKAAAKSTCIATRDRYNMLFNDYPKELDFALANLESMSKIETTHLQNLIQKIIDTQILIKNKEALLSGNAPTKPKVMEKTNQDKAINMLDTGVSGIFGATHFVFQSLADLTSEAEGFIRGKIKDHSKESIIENRLRKTLLRQEMVKAGMSKVKEYSDDSLNKIKKATAVASERIKDLAEVNSTSTITELQPDITTSSIETFQ